MGFHTKRSPSQSKRFLACAGTFALNDTIPEEQQNVSGLAAQMGTAVHGLVEQCLREGSDPESYRDRIIELVGDEESVRIHRKGAKVPGAGKTFFIVEDDMIDGAEFMTTYVRQRMKELGVDKSALALETRTNPLPERDDTSGTADVTIDAWPTLLEVVDYKNGYNVVETDSEQLASYLLGKALECDLSHERYCVTVCQPNAPHADGRKRTLEYTKAELVAFQKRLRTGIENCEKAEDEFDKVRKQPRTGEAWAKWTAKWLKAGDHCLFCDAGPVCPARIALAENDAQADFAEEPEELPEPTDNESVARILAWAPRMEALIKSATAWAQRSLEAGHAVPDYKLVRGRSVRQLVAMEEKKLVAAIVKGKYLPAAKCYTAPVLLSGPAMEKLVDSKRRKEFESKFMVKPEGKLTLAHVSDPRPEVVVDPAADFEDADEGDFG